MPVCTGDGRCISKEYGVYDYDASPCPHNCVALPCPNFAICGSNYPRLILTSYGNMCPKCHKDSKEKSEHN